MPLVFLLAVVPEVVWNGKEGPAQKNMSSIIKIRLRYTLHCSLFLFFSSSTHPILDLSTMHFIFCGIKLIFIANQV
jgi:hypothetical protein